MHICVCSQCVLCVCVCVLTNSALSVCPQWRSLSEEQQAIYFQQADREKQLHAMRNPGWSVRQNYVSTNCSHTTHTALDKSYCRQCLLADVRWKMLRCVWYCVGQKEEEGEEESS